MEEVIEPPMAEDSLVLNDTMTTMLYLTTDSLFGVEGMPVLYNSIRDGREFIDMVNKMRFYDGPIYILIRHAVRVKDKDEIALTSSIFKEKSKETKEALQMISSHPQKDEYFNPDEFDHWGRSLYQSHNIAINKIRNQHGISNDMNQSIYNIFGAYISVPIQDGWRYFGDQNCYLFSISPYLRSFYTSHEAGGQNYITFNSKMDKNHRGGLGFGKTQSGKCRLWIDENFDASYINYEDDTYEEGWLTAKPTHKLNVDCIEILGAGTYKAYQEYMRVHKEGVFAVQKPKPRPYIPAEKYGEEYLKELKSRRKPHEKLVKANNILAQDYKDRYIDEWVC